MAHRYLTFPLVMLLCLLGLFEAPAIHAQDGANDPTFIPETADYMAPYDHALQADGKVLVGGFLHSLNGTPLTYLARLNADGSEDETFAMGTGPNGPVYTIVVRADGKIMIGGGFTAYNGVPCSYIARLEPDGSLDPSFAQVGTGLSAPVLDMVVGPDGKCTVVGNFFSYDGISRYEIARLHNDGSLDLSFDPGTGVEYGTSPIALQADGKVLLGGLLYTYNGVPVRGLARVNVDGSLDTGFNPGGTGMWPWYSMVTDIVVQPDGQILIAGNFKKYNGVVRKSVARLNTNGTLAGTGFNAGAGAYGGNGNGVYALALQSNGQILAAGSFDTFGGVVRKDLVRLNTDGSVDPTLNAGSGVDFRIHTVTPQTDGKLIVSGTFDQYNGAVRRDIARVLACTTGAWYADADGDGFGDPAVELIACAQPAGYVANAADDCPDTPGLVGSACDDGNPNTTGEVLQGDCSCCAGLGLQLAINTDAAGEETTWEIIDQATNSTVATGGPYASNVIVTETICLPLPGCYRLRVLDAGGNGMSDGLSGGYVLSDALGHRIIDNAANGSFASQSQISGQGGFCLPLGAAHLVAGTCDRADLDASDQFISTPDPLVNPANGDGYQFWIFDPNGSYSRRVFQSGTVNNGWPDGDPNDACHLRFGWLQTLPVPEDVLLNVRVRTRINGSYGEFGPACRAFMPGQRAPERLLVGTAAEQMTLWPNPAAGGPLHIHLAMPEAPAATGTLRIIDPAGRPVASRPLTVQDGVLNTVVDGLDAVADGTYFVSVTLDGRVFTRPWVVMR